MITERIAKLYSRPYSLSKDAVLILSDDEITKARNAFEQWFVENTDINRDPLGGFRSGHQWASYLAAIVYSKGTL